MKLLSILILASSLFAEDAIIRRNSKKKPPPPPYCSSGPHVVPLTDVNKWTLSGAWYSGPSRPTLLTGGGIKWSIPTWPSYLGYIMANDCGFYPAGFMTATFTVVTTGTPVFRYDSEPGNTCVTPATIRMYFEKLGTNQYDRWWSNPQSHTFVPGTNTITFTVPLDATNWSSLYGNRPNFDSASAAGFILAQQQTSNIGFTMGGGCFFGHGVAVQGGTAEVRLTNFSTF